MGTIVITKRPKDPLAVKLGQRGGAKNSPAQQAQRRRSIRLALAARWPSNGERRRGSK